MMRPVLHRLGWSVVIVWFVVTATFAMLAVIPADPMRTLLGPHATPETIERARAHYCLDDGMLGQYRCWLGNVARGDLGESYRSKRAVTAILAERAWPTVQLALAAIVLQLVIGVPMGVIAAVRRKQWPDHAAGIVALLGQSAPAFVVGTIVVYLFSYRFGWFPISGYGDAGWSRVHHLVLPALTLAAVGIASYARIVRAELGEALAADHVRTARAKGLAERTVVLRHALRGALGPLITLIGLDLGVLLGGAVVVEWVFSWPGLGREVLRAVMEADLPLILGAVLVSAITVAAANLLVDLVQLWVDPRLRDR
jgi:peptide/nickel transport system permease protein